MTLLDRLVADRTAVRSHPRFVASESSGWCGEFARILLREPCGALAKTPRLPAALAWAKARAHLELQDEAEAAAGSELARAASFVDEELRAAVQKAVA